MATRITSGGNNRRQIVEEADSFNHANVDEIYWSSGSVNSPLVVNAPEVRLGYNLREWCPPTFDCLVKFNERVMSGCDLSLFCFCKQTRDTMTH